jgi:PAS domain S-box-containing protein
MKDQDTSVSPPSARHLRLLIIEDDATDVELALRELKRAGLQVEAEVIQTPGEFERCLDKASYDAVLSDYRLPGWTGLDAAVRLRKRRFYIPFILLSGILGDEAAVECIKQGISDYVLKDHLSRLPVALERALQEQQLRRARAWGEQEVRQREKRFRAIIENSSDGIAMVGPDGMFLPSTPSTVAALGWTPEDVAGMSLFELVHPEDVATTAAVFADVLASPTLAIPFQLRARHRDGSWRWVEGVGRNLLAEPSVQAVVIHYRDITGRKEQESEIRRLNEGLERMVAERTAELEAANRELERKIADQKMAEEALANLQRDTELILNSAGDGILRVDVAGRCTFANAAAGQMLGYAQEEFLGRDLHLLGLDSWPVEAQTNERCACGARRQGIVRRNENQMIPRKDGSAVPVDTSTTPIIERGQIAGAVVTL